jgi:hypothetical protein
MVEQDAVTKDFRQQVLGYGLTTAEIVYRRPDRRPEHRLDNRSSAPPAGKVLWARLSTDLPPAAGPF